MRRTFLSYFLMLLLAVAALDDACAAATPDPSDDAVATENDEYLSPVGRPDGRPARDNDRPSSFLNAAAGGACAAARGTPADSDPVPLAGPSRLYVFMSLRR